MWPRSSSDTHHTLAIMLTMAGNRGPMVVTAKKGEEVKTLSTLSCSVYIFCLQANTERPAWSEEELQARGEVFTDLGEAGGFSDAGLKKQIMVDRSAPVVNGEQEEYASHLL